MATCTVQDMMEVAKCYSCLTPKQLMEVRVALLCQILHAYNPMASCDIHDLMESAKCYSCLDLTQLSMIQTQLLCEILHAGGGTGSSCLFCGAVDPTEDPPCDCALYYNTANSAFWYWDGATWIPFIGGGGQ
jgi:hypothetical protein